MSTKSMYERASELLPPVANRVTKLGIVKGEGAYLWDENGKKYLDFGSGIGVTNVGHNHPYVIEKAKEQMDSLVHGCHNVVYYPSYLDLAEKIVHLMDGDYKVYFSNSGAEAVEGTIKLAKRVSNRPGIISFKRSFHGRTMGATSITASNSHYRKQYEGLMPSVYYAEYPYTFRSNLSEEDETNRCITYLNEIFNYLIAPDQVAAIIMEPVQGEGGYIVPPKSFVTQLRDICDQHGIFLIFDEVQTGFGRTGRMFAWEHFGVKPDIFSVAKGIANGFPLSAVIAKKDIMDQWPAGAHGGTFGGNPVACAASLAVIELLESGLIKNAEEMGQYFMERLNELKRSFPVVADVRGLGLMVGVEFLKDDGTPDSQIVSLIRESALEKGLLLLPCGVNKNVIRFIPPTIITKSEIDTSIQILTESLKTVIEKV
ncbi:aminotransferase class III-fold pyridoxal phosphate-dependent enzyme [Terrilactibacillus sp. BCM23-1]|uniref:(S)-3-amino-2-methylpropionate transaminase n=1 Tax=Terrilactibacillus tamarindi TaxID=2599694 RepID=A0A6N8CRE0_9BACI|nr:aspartate aminotransferase family protein [Terrilactibacillus tamarindi]MTT32809.1 aminotransferase class III-fold pyridoxal phosphate-dependent enzyme [Terrilactibacillus tamarindi]